MIVGFGLWRTCKTIACAEIEDSRPKDRLRQSGRAGFVEDKRVEDWVAVRIVRLSVDGTASLPAGSVRRELV
jgi:hypothetical protein